MSFLLAGAFAACLASAATPDMVQLPAESPFPESVAAAADGTLYASSLSNGGIVRVPPGANKAEAFIAPGANGSGATLGVVVDDARHTLWVCSNQSDRLGPRLPGIAEGAFLKSFALPGGEASGSYALPGNPALCNDIAIGADGTVYVTNTRAPQILRLRPGAAALEIWLEDDALKGGLDGIAFGADGNLYVNTYYGGGLFRIAVAAGAAGAVTPLALSRPLTHPDALKAIAGGFLMVEGTGSLDHVTVTGDSARIETIKPFAGPTGVVVAGPTIWVAEGQLDHLGDAAKGLTPPSFQLRSLPLAVVSDQAAENGGITLPPGFSATIFADRVGHVRHLAVGGDGTVYANSWSGRYYRNDTPPDGGFLLALKDVRGSGRAERIVRFGSGRADGVGGGTGIALFDGFLYAEVDDRIVRYAVPPDGLNFTAAPETVVSGLPMGGDHPMHPFVIGADGGLYVDSGSATNSCQSENRVTGSAGALPCGELETRGGIWRYDARRTGQLFSPAERFATGLRNGEGLAFDGAGRLFATQHGRDQLSGNWGQFFTSEQNAELPAEEVVELTPGADFGWPYCYYDGRLGRLMLAPEYGGDGRDKVGQCAGKQGPVASFPAHWAPNDMAIYQGAMFPKAWRNGAFIAFHGSWNRAPAPQGGYDIVFQPLAGGKASGPWLVFADGFAGGAKDPGGAAHRPTGLAVGPDGALYIADDKNGRIWRGIYRGDADTPLQAAAAATAAAPGTSRPSMTAAKGVPAARLARGEAIFHGEAGGGSCAGCHGADGAGSANGADLVSGPWLWSKGDLGGIRRVIAKGVAQPKDHAGVMPPMGGAKLSPADLDAVAAYVWAISRDKHV